VRTVVLLLWLVGLVASIRAARDRRKPEHGRVLFAGADADAQPAPVLAREPARTSSWHARLRTPAGIATLALTLSAVLVSIDSLRTPRTGVSTRSTHGVTRQITSERGVEAQPALSPDGAYVAYRQEIDGVGTIMVRSLDNDHAHSATAGLGGDHGDPAFSPDGRQIAFRSTHKNGGIFVIDRGGGPARRLTAFGASPAWTPDGASIVFARRSAVDPRAWNGPSEGWIVDVRTGRTTRLVRQDFRQPAVSPDGRRIAYWGTSAPRPGGRRFPPRIWVAGIEGRNPQPVSRGMSTDWSPVWSPGGEFLYFLSDRGGRTAIWRVSIDRRTGRPLGEPVRLAARTDHAAHLTIARGVGHLAWSTLEWSPALFRVAFEADARAIRGNPRPVPAGPVAWVCAEPSPDDSTIAMVTPRPDADVQLLRVETGALTAVTRDAAVEGCPRWSPDGRRLVFHSDAGGTNTLWTANADGSGLRQAGAALGELEDPVWSPDSESVAAWDPQASALRHVRLPRSGRPSSRLLSMPPHPFTPVAWSPDGSQIAGTAAGSLWLYILRSRMYEPLLPGSAPAWLSSGRRLIFASDGRLMMLDLSSRYTREILALPELYLDAPLLSPDDRTLYFNRNAPESNVWVVVLH